MRATLAQAFRDDLGVGFEDDGQVGSASVGVESPEERRVNAVEALHDFRRSAAVMSFSDSAATLDGYGSMSLLSMPE